MSYTTRDGQRVHTTVAASFDKMAQAFKKAFGLSLHVRSGVRTRAEQMARHRKYLKGGTLALHPDSPLAYHVESNPKGPRALDIYDSGTDAGVTRDGNKRSAWIKKNARKYRFDPAGYRFSQKEPWHIEFTGALRDGAPASITEEDDMPLSNDDIQKVAQAVWEYESKVNGRKFGDMLRRVFNVGEALYESVRYGKKGVRHHGLMTADTLARLGRMEANQEAQKAAIEALATANGADPAAILKAVEDGVSKAMDSIEVTLSVDAQG